MEWPLSDSLPRIPGPKILPPLNTLGFIKKLTGVCLPEVKESGEDQPGSDLGVPVCIVQKIALTSIKMVTALQNGGLKCCNSNLDIKQVKFYKLF